VPFCTSGKSRLGWKRGEGSERGSGRTHTQQGTQGHRVTRSNLSVSSKKKREGRVGQEKIGDFAEA
jgi:hypothetical protein